MTNASIGHFRLFTKIRMGVLKFWTTIYNGNIVATALCNLLILKDHLVIKPAQLTLLRLKM